MALRLQFKSKHDSFDGQTDVAGESETGKIYRANFQDKSGHTVLVMHPGRQVGHSLPLRSTISCL